MARYKVAIGWGVDPGDLAVVVPQPRNGEVQATERTFSDGGVRDLGLYSRPQWNVLGSDALYQSILTQFGVVEADECEVTWQTLDDTFAAVTYEGWAVRPKPVDDGGLERFFLRDVGLLIRIVREVEA